MSLLMKMTHTKDGLYIDLSINLCKLLFALIQSALSLSNSKEAIVVTIQECK